MPILLSLSLFLQLLSTDGHAQAGYGANGIFPVYDTGGQWLIFDKTAGKARELLKKGNRFLVVGSQGSEVFEVARTSGTYGGACRNHRPLKLTASLLKGSRRAVGHPIIGIHVPDSFKLSGSKARYVPLKSEVGEDTYAALEKALKRTAIQDLRTGDFHAQPQDEADVKTFLQNPQPQNLLVKIDFGSRIDLKGLNAPFFIIEETQIKSSFRRCLRLTNGDQLIGKCVEMPRALMAETALLQFVSYDPGAKGRPYILAFTPAPPLWGDERWGFIIREDSPRLFLMDAMDVRCREGF